MNKLIGVIKSENKLTGSLGVRNEINVEIIGTGARGKEGKSAYESWLDLGNEGTEQDFINFLKSEDVTYIHTQLSSSIEWIITHNLKKFPSVTIVDTGGNVVVGEVNYISVNQLKISFTYEFSGTAYLN